MTKYTVPTLSLPQNSSTFPEMSTATKLFSSTIKNPETLQFREKRHQFAINQQKPNSLVRQKIVWKASDGAENTQFLVLKISNSP